MKFGIGQATPRLEDSRLLTGAGCYSDDVASGTGLRVAFLRAPFSHAHLLDLDVAPAAALHGVHLVATQADLDADNVGEIQCKYNPPQLSGGKMQLVSKPPMMRDLNRHAGDIVAMVVADTQQIADDALAMITAEFEPLPSVTDVYDAVADGAPQLYPEYPKNIAFAWGIGATEATTETLENATSRGYEIIDIDVINNRIVINSLETRPIVAAPGAEFGHLDVWCGTQGVRGIADQIAAALSMEPSQVRVRTGDVGGSFGFKIFLHPEQVCVAWAARKLGCMVRWQQARSDGFLSDLHGRDNRTKARAAVDKNGRVHALQVDVYANMGSWLSNFSTYIPTLSGSRSLTSIYDIQLASLSVRGVMTNTPAVDAYRGAGRPEANYVIERLMDHIAAQLGLDRIAVRKTNMIRPNQIPYQLVSGGTIDSGDIPGLLDKALEAADAVGFDDRRQQSLEAGKWLGIGFGMYLEQCGEGADEGVDISFADDGHVLLHAAQQCNGQAHRTTVTQILSDRLGYDADMITVVQGDSHFSPRGTTGGARMSAVLGSATAEAAALIVKAALPYAAAQLACDGDNLAFADGLFLLKDSNQSLHIEDLVRALVTPGQPHPLNLRHGYASAGATYPYGCHVVELEVDPATAAVEIKRYHVTDDFGVVINPTTLVGQIHGGIVQGVGQALFEHVVYDSSGQLLTGSLMDYALPRAADFPGFSIQFCNTRCHNNVLGVKGAGEAGAIGAPQAIISALCDALSITHIDMPATPAAIFAAIRDAKTDKEITT